MKTSPTFSKVSFALINAKKKFGVAKKSGYNTHLKSHYSTLNDVLEAVEPGLKDCDLMILQSNLETTTEKVMHIETLILHESGEWLAFQYNMPIEKINAQAYGSTTSYGRRYALCAALGISQSDDDGEIAKRSSEDYKKLIVACGDLEALRTIHQSAKQALGASEWRVVEEHLLKRKAELNAATATGFKPAAKVEPRKQVEAEPQKEVKSQSINEFE